MYGTLQKRPLEADVESERNIVGDAQKKAKSDAVQVSNGVDEEEDEDGKDILERTKADELDDVVDDYEEEGSAAHVGDASVESAGQETAMERQYVPLKPESPIILDKNPQTGKYTFPIITKEDSLNARSYLKHFGSAKFLDDYLPEDLNSLYVYHMIKLASWVPDQGPRAFGGDPGCAG